MKNLSKKYRDLIRGASILSTGGGGKFKTALKLFNEIPESVQVKSVEELDENAKIVMAYGLGSTEDGESTKKEAIQNALEIFNEKYQREIDGVIPGELGPTQLYSAFQAASILNVPVLDTDTEGGRCVPELSMSFLKFDENSEPPIVISDGEQNTISIENIESIEKLENLLRDISMEIGLIGGLGHRRTLKDIKPYLLEGTLSKAQEVGHEVEEKGLSSFSTFDGVELIEIATVDEIEEKEGSGFYIADVFIGDYKVRVKNEYLKLERDGEIIAEAPERIFLIDSEELKGVYSGELNEGMEVGLFIAEPKGLWKTERGEQLFENHL